MERTRQRRVIPKMSSSGAGACFVVPSVPQQKQGDGVSLSLSLSLSGGRIFVRIKQAFAEGNNKRQKTRFRTTTRLSWRRDCFCLSPVSMLLKCERHAIRVLLQRSLQSESPVACATKHTAPLMKSRISEMLDNASCWCSVPVLRNIRGKTREIAGFAAREDDQCSLVPLFVSKHVAGHI